MQLAASNRLDRVKTDEGVSTRLKRLQRLVNQLLLQTLQLLLELTHLEVLAWNAAEKWLVGRLRHHLNVLEISGLGLNLNHAVKGWHNLHSHH